MFVAAVLIFLLPFSILFLGAALEPLDPIEQPEPQPQPAEVS